MKDKDRAAPAGSGERYRGLFETLPLGVIYYAADGAVLAANPAVRRILGLDPAQVTTWPLPSVLGAVHEDGTPIPRGEFPVMKALRTGEVVPDVVLGVPRAGSGEVRWMRVTAVPDAMDEQGRPQRAYAIFADITDEHRAEATVRGSTKLLGHLRDAGILGVVANSEQGILDANDAFLNMVGYSRSAIEAGRLTSQGLTAPEYASQDEAALRQLRATGVAQPYAKEYIHRDGRRVHVLVGAAVSNWDPLRWVVYAVDITARQRSEQERAELLVREQAARVEAGAAGDRLALLLGAGDLVASAMNQQELLDRAAQLLIRAVADYCVLFLPAAQGRLRVASLADRDPARTAILRGLREVDVRQYGPLCPQRAFTQAAAQLVTDMGVMTRMWSETARNASDIRKVARILERAGSRSAIAVPLLVGRQPLGVLMLGRCAGREHFTQTDLTLITELARRLAGGLVSAETFARDHTVAETLQDALLSDVPREIAGLYMAVRYIPAVGGTQVGGDWYDAFPAGPGRVGLAVGDVAGHSIGSASVMGQIRNLLRAYALEHSSPADVLAYTNAATSRLLPEAVATVFYAVFDLATRDLVYASAGHPPALLSSGGHTEYLDDAPGVMLGVSEDATYPTGRRRLAQGAQLLLYTDGLIEDRQRDITEGLSVLARAMRLSRFADPEQTCRFVKATLLGAGANCCDDDVCIFAIRTQAGTGSSPVTRY